MLGGMVFQQSNCIIALVSRLGSISSHFKQLIHHVVLQHPARKTWILVLMERVIATRDTCLRTAAIVIEAFSRMKKMIPANVMSVLYSLYLHNYVAL